MSVGSASLDVRAEVTASMVGPGRKAWWTWSNVRETQGGDVGRQQHGLTWRVHLRLAGVLNAGYVVPSITGALYGSSQIVRLAPEHAVRGFGPNEVIRAISQDVGCKTQGLAIGHRGSDSLRVRPSQTSASHSIRNAEVKYDRNPDGLGLERCFAGMESNWVPRRLQLGGMGCSVDIVCFYV